LDDRVVVEPMEAEERTSGGIVFADSAKERPQRGTIVRWDRANCSTPAAGGLCRLPSATW